MTRPPRKTRTKRLGHTSKADDSDCAGQGNMSLRLTLLAALALALCAGPVWADTSFESAFEHARALRTTDPKALGPLLDQLEASADTLSETQRHRLTILRAHQMAVTGNTRKAITSLRRLTTMDTPEALRYEAGALLANTYAITREFEEALRILEQVLPLQQAVADREIRYNGLQVAGVVYNQVGEFRIGMDYAQQVLASEPDARSLCIASNLVLESKIGLDLPITQAEADGAVGHCDRAGEPILAGFSRGYAAAWLHRIGRTADAVALLDGYVGKVEAAGYPLLIGQFHSALAEYRMALGQHAAAARHARATVEAISSLKSALALAVAYRTLYELALRDEDPAVALGAHRLYAEAERAHFNDVKSREMAYQVVRHQSLQQAQQIELLHQKNALLELQKRVTEQRAQSWLWLALVLVVGMTSVGYWAYKTKRLQMRLRRMTEIDSLTGICNRQHFSERSASALAGCERDAEHAVLLMFDLDHFKQVNDRFGHAAGDWALRQVADAVRPLCRRVDAFGRLGGEEFALFLPGLDAAAGIRLAGDVQARFGAIDTGAAGYGFRIAASFGVAAVDSADYSLATLMRQADQAMYAAKRGGRGQVRVFETAMESDTFETSPAPIDLLRRVQRDDVTNPAATQPSDAGAQRAIA
ncbi:GGDEF domain-containing protein [Luteimonas sp. 3794]|uniref:tetratricopeptide repeat-containing diguanylate cyclase n=1 Tax=Luteimonas sp. 3794 TaxID=2817730 RepID=UPI00286407E0|nr:GGDEF domain-containing protein [Luteimonas sp. 3794]MDR6992530.1 diguanylate cyclase (GGDEF)-like protein [Luteimonas sp. 3794]